MLRGEGQDGLGDVAHLVADVRPRPDERVRQPPGDDGVGSGARCLALHHELLVGGERLAEAGDAHVHRGVDHLYVEAPGQRSRDVVVPSLTCESHS